MSADEYRVVRDLAVSENALVGFVSDLGIPEANEVLQSNVMNSETANRG